MFNETQLSVLHLVILLSGLFSLLLVLEVHFVISNIKDPAEQSFLSSLLMSVRMFVCVCMDEYFVI